MIYVIGPNPTPTPDYPTLSALFSSVSLNPGDTVQFQDTIIDDTAYSGNYAQGSDGITYEPVPGAISKPTILMHPNTTWNATTMQNCSFRDLKFHKITATNSIVANANSINISLLRCEFSLDNQSNTSIISSGASVSNITFNTCTVTNYLRFITAFSGTPGIFIIKNCTGYGLGSMLSIVTFGSTAGSIIANNIVYGRNTEEVVKSIATPLVFIDKNNIWYNFTAWENSGILPDVTTLNVDPLFIAAPADLNLEVVSPGIDSADPVYTTTPDIIGTVRPQGTIPDRGAYELIPIPFHYSWHHERG